MSEVQKLALEHSHAVKRQHSKAREAGYRVDEVYSGVNPHLNFKAGTSYLTPTVSFAAPNGSLSITESGNYSVGLHLEQVVQLEESLAEAEQNVILQVERLHLELTTTLEQLRVAQAVLVQADEHLRLAQLRYKVGVSTNLELLQAETSQAEASLAVHQTHHSVLRNYYLWKRATGLDLGLDLGFALLREGAVSRCQDR